MDIQLPAGFRQLETQVAGHTFQETNKEALGLLQDADTGYVLKPFGKPECGERELGFYESLQAAMLMAATSRPTGNDIVLAQANAFVPKFFDKIKLVVNKREHTFLKMEDLTHGMTKPCVIDIKIGKRTWDPLASPHKRAVEEQKYVQCKQKLGLCVPGFQVYTTTSTTSETEKTDEAVLIRRSRDYGKNLDVEGFRSTIALFLNTSKSTNETTTFLIREVLRQLYIILDWFQRQTLFHFYASSLLIAYDYVKLQQQQLPPTHTVANGCLDNVDSDGHATTVRSKSVDHHMPKSQWVKVKMIDFAHVFPAESETLDNNYLFGLENLIKVIEELLDR